MPMFFIQFEGTPRRDAQLFAHAAGAYINCWMDRPTLAEAVRDAQANIEDQGWIVDNEPEAAHCVTAADYPPGESGRERFEQALIDKEVFVYHCFPEVDAEDGDAGSDV